MADGIHYFEGFGRCVYCLASELELTDEHIVPYGLAGQQVIRKASCKNCAKITSKFERDVMRGMWGEARIAFNFPSRRKKSRPKTIKVAPNLKIPVEDYAPGIPVYTMPECGAILGLKENVDLTDDWLPHQVFCDHEKLLKFKRKYGIEASFKFRHMPKQFGQLIAKIAFCNALTSFPLDSFEATSVAYLMDDTKNISFIVGSKKVPNIPTDKMYALGMRIEYKNGIIFIFGTVRLFCNFYKGECIEYYLLVGLVRDENAVREFLKHPNLEGAKVYTQSLPR